MQNFKNKNVFSSIIFNRKKLTGTPLITIYYLTKYTHFVKYYLVLPRNSKEY